MQELTEAAAAQEIILSPALADRMAVNTRAMGAYYASTVIDFQLGRSMELESLFLNHCGGHSAGATIPRLEAFVLFWKADPLSSAPMSVRVRFAPSPTGYLHTTVPARRCLIGLMPVIRAANLCCAWRTRMRNGTRLRQSM